MAAAYNHKVVEKKWRGNWEAHPINVNDGKKPKYYCLDMFPYPSGSGLHVGHWRGYVISDVWSRYKMMHGYYVIHPMGWDAFGLPAENYAIKNGVHPRISTASNIANIKRQIQDISAVYDWDMEVNTTDPEFYKWTQWIFVKMFKAGLAYEKEMPINWCPSCKTGLANEEVVNGCCERCHSVVTKKDLKQWMLKITAYADRLLDDLDKLDWPEKVKKMQSDWIGRSYGAEVDFKVEGKDESITVYTTRPDTLHGATFMVLAPEHKLAKSLATDETRKDVEEYIFRASTRSNIDRMQDKEKTGVFTGSYEPTPLILPVQYTANIIIINGDKEGNVNADTYLADEEGYTNAANTLNIATADDTKIVDKNEKEYKGDLDKNDLIVFYGVSTKSIPAQTTPTKVVVLGENEIALKQIEAAKNATPAPTAAPEVTETPQVSYAGLVNVVIGDKNVSDVYAKDNTTMVPLREVAEAAGFTVTWDAENRAVILNDGVYSLKIGENSYVKGKMMPLTLSAAPEIVNDLTYVPAEFFAEVTESATVDGTSLVVTAK